ncbi:MAG: peptidoglycan-binding protein, partial [Candidatus Liptonbacteria bacterium]|nr:peptidoglycan-binding protein [Candidatus Liptonbacteria bacterium]
NSPDTPKILEEIKSTLESILRSGLISGGEPIQVSPSVVPPAGSFTVSLSQGSEGQEVTALQSFLKSQGADIYPEGLITGYFGALTKEAVGRFQLKYGILTSENDAGYGYVGPRTREKINSLLGL